MWTISPIYTVVFDPLCLYYGPLEKLQKGICLSKPNLACKCILVVPCYYASSSSSPLHRFMSCTQQFRNFQFCNCNQRRVETTLCTLSIPPLLVHFATCITFGPGSPSTVRLKIRISLILAAAARSRGASAAASGARAFSSGCCLTV